MIFLLTVLSRDQLLLEHVWQILNRFMATSSHHPISSKSSKVMLCNMAWGLGCEALGLSQ